MIKLTDIIFEGKLSKSEIKKMRDKFNKTGKLPPHLQKLADLMKKDTIQIMSIGVVPGTISILYSAKFLGREKSKIVLITKLVSLGLLVGGVIYFGPIYGATGLGWIVVGVMTWEAAFLAVINKMNKVN